MPRLDPAVLARHRRRNHVHSVLVLAVIFGLMALAGWLVAGVTGVLCSAVGSMIALLFQPMRSVMLMRALFGAVPLHPEQAPGLWSVTRELSRRAGLDRVPPLWYIPRPELLALSTGWGHDAAIAVSDGMLRAMPGRALTAVLAHELSHIRHGDLKMLRLAEAAGSLTRFLSLFGLLLVALAMPAALAEGVSLSLLPVLVLVAAPVVSDLMALKLSRTREFAADSGAAELTGDPRALVAALERLEDLQGGGWERLYRNPPTRWLTLIRTHPTTEERVGRLAEMTPEPEPRWVIIPDALVLPALMAGPHGGRRWWWI